jgi:hypothetical protein
MLLIGTLPVSAINVGLAASLGGLNAKVAKLQADVSALSPLVEGQAQLALDFPPNIVGYTATLAASNNPLEVAAALSPAAVTANGVDTNIELVAEGGFIEGQLAIVGSLSASLGAGLNAAGIGGWTYAGRVGGCGELLTQDTRTGYGRTTGDAQIQAVIIFTESFDSWGSFSQGCNTGSSSAAPAAATDARLAFLGELGGNKWNTGVDHVLADLDLFLAELEGLKASIDAQIAMTVGVGLPEVDLLVEVGAGIIADVGIDELLDSLVNVDIGLDAAIGSINLKLDQVLSLIADINGQLSAGGLSFWVYTGSASELGPAVRDALTDGLPGGSGPDAVTYGLVLAGTAASMATFGAVFKTS